MGKFIIVAGDDNQKFDDEYFDTHNGHVIYSMEELDEMHYRDMPKELREALGIKLEDKEKTQLNLK